MGFDHWMCGYTTDTCWSINDKWLVPATKSNAWIGDYHHVGTGNSRSSPTSICSGMTGLVCEDRLATGSFGLESQVLTLYWMLFLVVHRFSENTPGLESHYRSRHVINKRLKKNLPSQQVISPANSGAVSTAEFWFQAAWWAATRISRDHPIDKPTRSFPWLHYCQNPWKKQKNI